jgi:predicted acylesterase/phospholipase RssA
MTESSQKVRIAMVAGGGAVKAYAFHLGVLLGLEKDGFFFRSGLKWSPRPAPSGKKEISIYVGSSAGACVLASIASGHSIERLKQAVQGISKEVPTFGYSTLFVPVAPNPAKYARRLARRLKLGGVRPHHFFDFSGILTTAGVEKYFRSYALATNRFSDFAADLYITATQVNTSRKVVFGPVDSISADGYDPCRAYYDNVPVSQAVAATVAVPPVFAPYAIENPSSGKRFHYYDGEVREALSPHIARDAGAEFIIASSIWNPYCYDERVGTLSNFGMAVLAEQAINQIIESKVEQERRQTELYDRLLDMIGKRDARLGIATNDTATFKEEICQTLAYRPSSALYVEPDRSDSEFFFDGSFSFNRDFIERCVETGYKAYVRCAGNNRVFFQRLEEALNRQAKGELSST